jgi:hypothetical protein
MSSATKATPRFRVGDWVCFPVGFRKILARVVEDRGPVGTQAHRFYQVEINRGEDGGTETEVPEADLESAPEITTAELARENGLSTRNWPRQAFHVTYRRSKRANSWLPSVVPVTSRAVPPMELGPGGLHYAGDEDIEIVRVDVDYDPRLAAPQASPLIWTNLTGSARRIADGVFKARRPRAVLSSRS